MTVCPKPYSYTTTTAEELAGLSELEREQLADELLRESIEVMGRDQEYPFYSSMWLRCLCEADASLPAAKAACQEDQPDLMAACERLLDHTPMPRQHRRAFRLRLRGLIYRDIGQRLQVSLDTARRWVIKAKARLAAAAVGLDELLTESELVRAVFHAESRRHGYELPRHCAPGKERCRKTGKCAARWYLAVDQ